ncbi:hypothetical protein MesoLjLc_31260 [Mesorhizobium sp. L-8-10]|nr:hypothetical protein MesoLjLc_31260 [Mesorhizobium sp. L-8-10]
MRASRITDAQKAFIPKQAEEGMPVADVCRKAGISAATFFSWKKKYGGLLPTEMRRLKQLEDENAKLKKLVADLSLDHEMLQGRDPPKSLKPARKRKLVDEVRREWGVSIRRACRIFEFDTSMYYYRSRRPGQAPLAERIKDICATRVRYGYRRVHVLLRREGWMINHKRTHRIHNELGLQLRSKSPKRRVKAKLREDRVPAVAANETWATDFVNDQLASGRKLRILTIDDRRHLLPLRAGGRRQVQLPGRGTW